MIRILYSLYFSLFFLNTLCAQYSDNIFEISYSNRNLSLGGGNISSNNIGAIFNAPYIPDFPNINNCKNLYIAYNQHSKNLFNVFYLAFNIYIDYENSLSCGLVNRKIPENYNTSNGWIDNGDGIPSLNEIDYNNIQQFSDNETGFVLSYNRKLYNSKSNLTINGKAVLHNVLNYSGQGLSLDIIYLQKINNINMIFGLNNLGAYKSWNYLGTERFESKGFVGAELRFENHIIFNSALYSMQYDSFDQLKIGIEYNSKDKFFTRFGYNSEYKSMGFGVKSKLFIIDYSYVKYSNINLNNSYNISFLFNINDFI